MKWRRVSQNAPLFSLTILLFLTCGAHYATTVYSIYCQNIVSPMNHNVRTCLTHTVPQSVNGLAGLNESSPINVFVAASLLFALANLFGDMTMIYRLWNFYQKNYLYVILPSLLSLAGCRTSSNLDSSLASRLTYLTVLTFLNTLLEVSGPDNTPEISDDSSLKMNLASKYHFGTTYLSDYSLFRRLYLPTAD